MSFTGEAVRRITLLEQNIDRLKTQEATGDVDSFILSLPGLRGYWPMSAIDASGNALDISGNGRTLTYNGNPTYSVDGFVPYIDLDGTGDYLSRADEAGLDILGTESFIASGIRGLTFGGWFKFDNSTPAANEFMIGKGRLGFISSTSYFIYRRTSDDKVVCLICDGSFTGVGSDPVTATDWFFCAARFDPSTELAIFIDNDKNTNTTAIPASIQNTSVEFCVGDDTTGDNLPGRASRCFLAAAAWPDSIIDAIFQRSRQEYGV